MFEENYGTNMSERITIILGHLQMESTYLDTVIESSLEIQKLLRESKVDTTKADASSDAPESTGKTTKTTSSLQMERNQRVSERLGEIRWEISNQFIPVLVARKKLPEILKFFDPAKANAPSLSSLACLVNEPFRTKLEELGTEIQNKLNQVYSINMGSQAILLYTLDYYDRLLNGSQPRSHYYNATGHTETPYTASVMGTNC